jgi:hypothetical protein
MFIFSWNSSWHCRGRKFDVTITVQEQLVVFTCFNSKDGTLACASGCDIMAGLTIAREQLWTGQYGTECRLLNHGEIMLELEIAVAFSLIHGILKSSYPWTQLYHVNYYLKVYNS